MIVRLVFRRMVDLSISRSIFEPACHIFRLKHLAELPIRHKLNSGRGGVNQQTHQNRIRLILLDDQALFRAGLGRLLASEPGFEVVGECASSTEALQMLSRFARRCRPFGFRSRHRRRRRVHVGSPSQWLPGPVLDRRRSG